MSTVNDIEAARLDAAEAEAKRFLKRLADLRAARKADPGTHPRESGAMKRASLDLTRALADVRRSPYST
ncbi:MAG: hypothetical protein JWR10_441 [Rubritepida sp.]|nr:hypothetical protein [Rubritepida sp.]